VAEYFSDFDDTDDNFEYDGRTDEELLERRMQKQREEQPKNNRPPHALVDDCIPSDPGL